MSEKKTWLPHGFKLAPSWFAAQAALGWAVIVALLALLGAAYLAQANQTIVSSYHMQLLTIELKELQEQNTLLEAQIANDQSVEHSQGRAIELGFVPAGPEDIEYLLVKDFPPALELAAPVEAKTTRPSDQPAGGAADWLRGLFQGFTGWTQSTAGGDS